MPWENVEIETIADCRVFSVNRNLARRTQDSVHDFYVLHPSNWVNIIAITPDNQVVLIEQFRHGTQSITLEIPGGTIDLDDPSAMHAAARELAEETGFVSEKLVYLGSNHPNPAIQSNICETFLAKNVRQEFTPRFETTEDIIVRLTPLSDIPKLIKAGVITHGLVIVAFHLLHLYEQEDSTTAVDNAAV